MSYAILRVEHIKTPGNAGSLSGHLERTQDTPNADGELQHLNHRAIGSGDLAADIQKRIEEAGVKVHKKAIIATEHLMTASPEYFKGMKKAKDDKTGKMTLKAPKEVIKNWQEFQKDSLKWLENTYGKKNVVNFTVHMDEKTPHIHAVVVPITERTTKKGVKKTVLSARQFFNGREKMRQMQDDFAKIHENKGLERGQKGSKATHQEVQKYYSQIKQDLQKQIDTEKQAKIEGGTLGQISIKKANEQIAPILEENRALKTQNQELSKEKNNYLEKSQKLGHQVFNQNRQIEELTNRSYRSSEKNVRLTKENKNQKQENQILKKFSHKLVTGQIPERRMQLAMVINPQEIKKLPKKNGLQDDVRLCRQAFIKLDYPVENKSINELKDPKTKNISLETVKNLSDNIINQVVTSQESENDMQNDKQNDMEMD